MKNVRINTDQRFNLSLKAGGASIDMTGIDVLSLYMYCNPQKARDGAIKHSVSTSDAKVLEMIWPADLQRYLGEHSVHGTIRYSGAVASFDVPAVNVVSLTSEADISTDTIVLEAPVGTEDLTATITIQGMGPKGDKGEPGPQGPQGDPGPEGPQGDKMTYADLTEADKEDIYAGGAEMLKPLFATKQDTLTAGNGISIEGNEIGVTYITESESQPDSSLWINPSEDEETDVTYNRSQIDAMVGAKQDTLQLTVKDNGNIILSNIQGQSKEFMPATPSGDPMHYAYEAAGAEYNDTGADIVKTTPWADLADDDADKTVVHKAGYWYLNGLGDITNEQMRDIYNTTINFGVSPNVGETLVNAIVRTNFLLYKRVGYQQMTLNSTFLKAKMDVIRVSFPGSIYNFCFAKDMSYMSMDNINTRHFVGVFNLSSATSVKDSFKGCTIVKTIRIAGLKLNISFSYSPMLTSKSILYMINNEKATSAITITLHADAYARAMANADIVAALEAHPNVSLASA